MAASSGYLSPFYYDYYTTATILLLLLYYDDDYSLANRLSERGIPIDREPK
jgi:hypothetical protein